jgi:hypothetical protein
MREVEKAKEVCVAKYTKYRGVNSRVDLDKVRSYGPEEAPVQAGAGVVECPSVRVRGRSN